MKTSPKMEQGLTQIERRPYSTWKTTSPKMKDNPKWKTIKMEDDHNRIQPKWKRPKWKTNKMEDKQNGR